MRASQEPSVVAYVRLIKTAEALHGAVSRGLFVDGLTASQFSTMKVLRIHGALAQKDIAKHILKTGGNITILVDNLERDGLVTRDRDTTDRRLVYVRLTPKGEETFDRIYPGHLERIREAMDGLSEVECEGITSLLEKLAPEQGEVVCATEHIAAANS